MGPKNILSTIWYLIQVRIRTWDQFPVITKVEEREIRTDARVRSGEGQVARIDALSPK